MELRHLRYFIAVAEEMHFGRAARRLHISQPPLSQQVRALEHESGVELFARIGRRVELTLAGKEFLNYARAALAQVEQGVRSAQRVHQGQLGSLSVGFITSMAYTYLPWVVRVFRGRYPEVELVLTEQETWVQVQALQESRLHVGLLRGPVDVPELSSITALTEPFVVALPDDHRFARARTVKLAALAGESFIMFPRSIGGHFYDAMMSLFQEAGFAPKVAQEAVQMHVAIGLVSARLGIALVPASTQLFLMAGVVFRPLAKKGGKAEIAIVRRAADASPVVRAFTEVAAAVISKGMDGIPHWRSI